MLDYYVAIEKFDQMVMRAIDSLERAGLLENTFVVVTSDNGMPFPRAKATLYDPGVRVPLAISWPARFDGGRRMDRLTLLSDLAPTFLEAAGLDPRPAMTGRSLLSLLLSTASNSSNSSRDAVFFGMERHSGSRWGGKGYPCRAIRTADYLYIRNFEPDRWPGGDPDPRRSARARPFSDVDSSTTKTLLMELRHQEPFRRYFELAFSKRPSEELYDLAKDSGQMTNVSEDPDYRKTKQALRGRLMEYLAATKDPRALGRPAPWDFYPHYGNKANPAWSVADPR
jgi:uncharacterized sulfatase